MTETNQVFHLLQFYKKPELSQTEVDELIDILNIEIAKYHQEIRFSINDSYAEVTGKGECIRIYEMKLWGYRKGIQINKGRIMDGSKYDTYRVYRFSNFDKIIPDMKLIADYMFNMIEKKLWKKIFNPSHDRKTEMRVMFVKELLQKHNLRIEDTFNKKSESDPISYLLERGHYGNMFDSDNFHLAPFTPMELWMDSFHSEKVKVMKDIKDEYEKLRIPHQISIDKVYGQFDLSNLSNEHIIQILNLVDIGSLDLKFTTKNKDEIITLIKKIMEESK